MQQTDILRAESVDNAVVRRLLRSGQRMWRKELRGGYMRI